MSQHSAPARHAVDDHFGEPQAVGDETVRDPTKIVNVAGRWRNRSSTGSQGHVAQELSTVILAKLNLSWAVDAGPFLGHTSPAE